MEKLTLLDRLRRNKPHIRKRVEIDLAWAARENGPRIARRDWLRKHMRGQSGRCHYCRIAMRMRANEPHRYPTIDHIIPLSLGGPDTFENTVAACTPCNSAKANLLPAEFQSSAFLTARRQFVNTPPNRLSLDIGNNHYDRDAIARGVRIFFNGREISNVEEYCVSEGWVAIPAGKAKTRAGRPVTIRRHGTIAVRFHDDTAEHFGKPE